MKKLLLSFFIAATLSSISFAQLGFKAGINIANQTNEIGGAPIELSSKIGPLLGINYKWKLSESIALRPGFQFASKGYSVVVNGVEVSPSINYLEVPIDVVYTFGKLNIHAGPYVSVLISAKALDLDLKESYKSLDAGLNVGLGFTIGNVGLGANYGLGLSNISNFKTGGTIKNKVLGIFLTYTL